MHLAKTSPRHRPGPDLPGDKVIPPPHQNRCQSVAWTWIAGQGEVIVRCEQEPHAGNFCSWQYDGARDVRTWDQNVTPSMTWDAIAGLRLPFGKKKEEEDA